MGFTNGRWMAEKAPNQIDYPFEIAAKLVRDSKSCTHDEVCKFLIRGNFTIYVKSKTKQSGGSKKN